MPLPPHPSRLRLTTGISDFARLRRSQGYYVDKTRELAALLEDDGGPVLLTRPRRFGKTLTLDTLRCLLELDYGSPGDTARQQELFDGLAILVDPELQPCRERCMGQHPVIALTLSGVEGESCADAAAALCQVVASLCSRREFLALTAHPALTAAQRADLTDCARLTRVAPQERRRLLCSALPLLAKGLHAAFGRSVYVLIDEYDTPLARAWSAACPQGDGQPAQAGYYEGMAALMRSLLQPLLKPGPDLQEAIARCLLTGCTRVSRESLFSGANNLTVRGMDDLPTAALMGFTSDEVQTLLSYYGLEERRAEVEEWYDGYRFAGVRIYNPWSIACCCQDACRTPSHRPLSYWAHAGRNDELSRCLHAFGGEELERLRRLGEGQRLALPLREAFSYDELLRGGDERALYTLLWHTGYLTEDDDGSVKCGPEERVMRMPNAEVRLCFEQQLLSLYDFAAEAREGHSSALVTALLQGWAEEVRRELTLLFGRYLSFHAHVMRSHLAADIASCLRRQDPVLADDFAALDDRRPERIYQLYVMGVLSGHGGGRVRELVMERELGEGRCDLSFISASASSGCVLEFKKAAAGSAGTDIELRESCRQAAEQGLAQIESRGYARGLLQLYPGLRAVQAYGIGCAGRRCAVAWRCCRQES